MIDSRTANVVTGQRRAVVDRNDGNLTASKERRLFLIHDLLPCQDESQGLTTMEIVELMTSAGYSCNTDTIARDLRELCEVVYLDPQRHGRKVFWKRLYETRLTDALAHPPALPTAGAHAADADSPCRGPSS